MGKLVKNHLARLVVLAAACYHVAASFECFFWPKLFWDFNTKNLDRAVRPVPILQTINIVIALSILALEWPVGFISKCGFHSSFELRLTLFPLASLGAWLMYQGTDPGLYYLIGIFLYFWAYTEGEVICAEPWTLPKKPRPAAKV